MAKVIISCAVTGAIHTPSMSDYLPITPEEIAEQSIEAAEAGAAIIHLHARDPQDGGPTPDPAVFMQFLPVIKQSDRCGDQHHHRRRPGHDAGRAAGRAAAGEARDVQPQHGQHELQHLGQRRRRMKNLEARLGEALPGRHRRLHLPQHLPGHRAASSSGWARATAPASSSNATTSATCTTWRTCWTARWWSRRCSCRRSSASWAASAPSRATCCS